MPQSEKRVKFVIKKTDGLLKDMLDSIRRAAVPKRYEDDLDDEMEFDPQYVQWSSSDGSIFLPASRTVKHLPPGLYEVDSNSQMGLYFERVPVRTEGLLRFPDTNSNKVVEEIKKFWELEQRFRDYNLSYKRGIVLYGPPGSGKSCTVQLVMEDVISRGGIVIQFWEPSIFMDGLKALRKIQPETPVVAIMEDLDSLLGDFSESEILNILDGVNEVDRVVFLATTNYPEKLGHRILNRPSRFDKRFRIGFPSSKSRLMYFESLIGKDKIGELDIPIEQWVKDSKKFSIAHLKELFVAVIILGDDYKQAVKTLRAMREEIDDHDYEGHFGFKQQEDDDEEDDS